MKLTISLVAVLFLIGAGFAQDKKVAQPDWVLTVTTSGGFGGNGKGNVQINSLGQVFRIESSFPFCGEMPPAASLANSGNGLPPLKTELFNSLAMAIDALPSFDVLQNQLTELRKTKSELSPSAVCSDCYQTKVHIVRREPDGKTSSFRINLSDVQNHDELIKLMNITDEILNFTPAK